MTGKAGVSGRRGPTSSVRKLGRLLSLLALLPALFMLAAPAHAAFPGENGKIAFNTNRSPAGIYTMDPDGTSQALLTAGEAGLAAGGRWSPDGKQMVLMCAFEQQDYVICTLNADGTGLTRLTAGNAPSWSPDGKKIAFARASDIWVMNADGTAQTKLTDDGAFPYDAGPVWSPDGEKIAFTRGGPIYLMNPDGTGITQLTSPHPARADGFPSWAPDGSKIAYQSSRDGPLDIYSLNADGTGLTRLTTSPNGQHSGSPSWSPDGQVIAFSSDRDDPDATDELVLFDVYTMSFDGTGVTRLTNHSGAYRSGDPDWQPILYGYARPKGATRMTLRFVPAFEPCASANASHGEPFAVNSCSPPVAASDFLTVGTPDSNGAAAYSAGVANLRSICNPPAPGPVPPCTAAGDQGDEEFDLSFTDVRQKPSLLDYSGELEARVTLRITDRWNGLCPGCPQPGTAMDVPFSFAVPCATTSDNSIGSTCSVTTTANAVLPGTVRESKRSVWQLGQFELYDGGPDGDADTPAGNMLFAEQGIFVP